MTNRKHAGLEQASGGSGSDLEIEVKIAIEDLPRSRRLLVDAGARQVAARTFEDNTLYDDRSGNLEREGRVLRLRRVDGRAVLTYKEPRPDLTGETGMKVARELECEVGRDEALAAILEGLGFAPNYRYQKYREVFALDDLVVTIDETPIGMFVELEGSVEGIRAAAARLGWGKERFIKESYRALHRAKEPWSRAMVFPEGALP